MMQAALAYAKMGIPVMPLKPRGKVPALADWVNRASTDPGAIRGWWGPRPDCNVGGVMGTVVCIDCDVDGEKGYDGRDWVAEWEAEHGKLPETATSVTGRGGMHLFYRVDREVAPSVNGDIHVDIRGRGSQAVLPPSVHPNGSAYFWDLDPADVGIADADGNVYALIEAARPAGGRADTTIPEGKKKEGEGRNVWLYRMGASQRGKGADDDVVWAYMDSLNRMKCSPPLDEREFEKVCKQVCKLPVGPSKEALAAMDAAKPRRGRPRKFEHNVVARRLIDEFGACRIDGVTPAIRGEDGLYRMGWEAFDAAVIDMHDDCTEANRREVKAYIRAKAPSRRQSPWNLIAFENGVLDVETMELRDISPQDVIPNKIPHRWNPEVRDGVLAGVLGKMACGDAATLMNLQEFIGICMMRSNTRMPFYPVLIGSGSNGKSTYIKLLKDVLGQENISALQPKEISAHFMGEHIVGKTANLGDDIADAYLDGEDCGAIKRISTGENIFTDVKGTKGFYFEPYCTMVFSCNAFPRCKDTTEGFLRRLFPIEFNAKFSPEDADYDPLVGERLRAEEALEAACVVGVEGLRRAVAQNQPTPNRMSGEVKRSIASESNTALQWFNDARLTRDDIAGRTKEEVYNDYRAWCERNGYGRTAMSSGTLAAQIGTYWHMKCSKIEHRTYSNGRKTVRVFE